MPADGFTDLDPGSARRIQGADDRPHAGAGDDHRPDAHGIQCFQNGHVRQAAHAAAAQGQSDGFHGMLSPSTAARKALGTDTAARRA